MIFWDQEMTQPITQMLYQREGEATLYVDADFTTVLHVIPVTSTDSSSEGERNTAEVSLPSNQGFSRDQTLFLIDLMRQHLMKDHADLPKTLSELNSRVKMGRGQKKVFWQNIATKLSNQFHQKFEVEKVARK